MLYKNYARATILMGKDGKNQKSDLIVNINFWQHS